MDRQQLRELWDQYKADPSREIRDRLVTQYLPLVNLAASQVGSKLPPSVDHDDLNSYGVIGLMDAITKFDPSLGFKFETYAISRIRGAIIDELRAYDWVPRSVRTKAKALERSKTRLSGELKRFPTSAEVAADLDLDSVSMRRAESQVANSFLEALDEPLGTSTVSSTVSGGDFVAVDNDIEDIRLALADSIQSCNERERIVLTLYYYENLTLDEIGDWLGVTESRVCQIHTAAMIHIRSGLSILAS